ncbi:hypothetical protein COP2_018420 [Malus domestica]
MRANQKKGEEEADQSGEGKEGKEGEWCTEEQEKRVVLDPCCRATRNLQSAGFRHFRPNFRRIESRYHS